MLNEGNQKQLAELLTALKNDIRIRLCAGPDGLSKQLEDYVLGIASMSPKIKVERVELRRVPSFTVDYPVKETGITFAGIPAGHEFGSLLKSLAQVGGSESAEDCPEQMKGIEGELRFETYIAPDCPFCPPAVQTLNTLSVLNPGVSHTMIDVAFFGEETAARDVMVLPTVYLNGERFAVGGMAPEDILEKLGNRPVISGLENQEPFDTLVIGGGPAGVSAAVYGARKGIRVGLVAENFGGQLRETLGIENLISVGHTEGPALAGALERNLRSHDVEVISPARAKRLERKEMLEIELENGAILKSKTAVLATGSRWKTVNVPGEAQFKTRGVAYCAHCDGPLYKEKDVAVIGGGNSGIEAAIDLAGIAKHVTVLEFAPELKADRILRERLKSLDNVTVITGAKTKEITGTDKVNGLVYENQATGETHRLELEGVFVQIGLAAHTGWLGDSVLRNDAGEIVIARDNAASMPGVYAAGDCTDSPYKQVVIAIASGASAALSAFDYIIRH
jgi:alkyl hydroperoxide reductase subunit F